MLSKITDRTDSTVPVKMTTQKETLFESQKKVRKIFSKADLTHRTDSTNKSDEGFVPK